VALSVHVLGTSRNIGLTTVDVSQGGMFLHTSEPTPIRQLLRLRINPGDGRDPIVGHGMVIRVVDAEEAALGGGETGMGVEFYGFGGEPRERWNQLLSRLATAPFVAAASASPKSVRREVQPVYCEAAQRLPGKSSVLLLLRTRNVEQLYEVCDHHLPAASVLVQTAVRLAPGTPVDLRFTHPLSRDVYDLHGTVRQVLDDEPGPGLDVSLTPGVGTRQDELRRFIDAGLPEEELAIDLVDGEAPEE